MEAFEYRLISRPSSSRPSSINPLVSLCSLCVGAALNALEGATVPFLDGSDGFNFMMGLTVGFMVGFIDNFIVGFSLNATVGCMVG